MTDHSPHYKVPVIHSHILDGICHGFFTRQGGVSVGVYASLNCSLKGDLEENVKRNRLLALEALSLQSLPLCLVKQVHGKEVVVVDTNWHPDLLPVGDALVTTRQDVVLGIQTADCVPVLLADRAHGVIGAVHAGWRGALKGVVEAAVDQMLSLGAKLSHLKAAIGPAIAQESYEVGPEVFEQFTSKNPSYEKFFFFDEKEDFSHFDLPGYVEYIAVQKGLEVERLPYDTYAHEDQFFSCRRSTHDQSGGFGGHLSVISLAEGKIR